MSRRLSEWRVALCAFALTTITCAGDGTETDNPVIDFETTECKSHGNALLLESTVARTRTALEADPHAYDGLYCYAWDRSSDEVTIDVVNYSAGCTIFWTLGESRVDGDRISLGIHDPYCGTAACGSCVYDFSFIVEGVDLDAPARVRLRETSCERPEILEPEVLLAVDERETGIICRVQPTYAFEEQCGRPYLSPCRPDSSQGTCDDGCGEGLTCAVAESEDGRDLCLTACEADDDCPLAVESCQDGACRLRETF